MSDILLDSEIRDWVLLPLCLITFLVGILQNLAIKIAASNTPATEEDVVGGSAVQRSVMLRTSRAWLFPESFKSHAEQLANPTTGLLPRLAKEKSGGGGGGLADMEKMMMDPSMVKMQLFSYLPYIFMLMLVQSFFSGFVLAKVPLALHPRMKPLFQRDVDLPFLPTAYITSMCLYILLSTAYRSLYPHILAGNLSNQYSPTHKLAQAQAAALKGFSKKPAAQYTAEAQALTAPVRAPCKLTHVEALIRHYPPGRRVLGHDEAVA